MILRGVQFRLTGLPAWRSGQPGQVGNQAALTVEPVLGSRSVTYLPLFLLPNLLVLGYCTTDLADQQALHIALDGL